jgi:hypothetical protein
MTRTTMKIIFTLCVFFFLLFPFAQDNARIEAILAIPRTPVEKLEITEGVTVTYLPTTYANSSFDLNTQLQKLEGATILRVYYVYTRHRRSEAFNQMALDRERLLWLNSVLPEIVSDPFVQWEILEQTGATDYESGQTYFHGFVIIHRPVMTEEERQKEITRLMDYLENPDEVFFEMTVDPIASQTGKEQPGTEKAEPLRSDAHFPDGESALFEYFQRNIIYTPDAGRFDGWVEISFAVLEDGTIDSLVFRKDYPPTVQTIVEKTFNDMPEWKPETVNGKPVYAVVNLEVRVSYSPDVKGMYTRDGQRPNMDAGPGVAFVPVEDENNFNLMTPPQAITVKSSAVYKGLDLYLESTGTALVMDVTGSMTTHIAAMKNWIRSQKTPPFTSYTFFNDGDKKTSKEKKIGETGGIYMCKVLDDMDKTIEEAMNNGTGGEEPENDLEAVLHAIAHDENAKEILLIGDNYSEVKDISLLNKINRPVHVLVCAAPKFVRCEYLKIAKETGGKVILNGALIDLAPIVKGDKIVLNGVDYKYNGTDFEIDYKGQIFY